MRLFYWIRYNLGKTLLILIFIWALLTGLKYCSNESTRNKSRPDSIDFRPIKEGKHSDYNRRPRTHLEKMVVAKPTSRKKAPIENNSDDQFTITNETQSMLIEMKKELSDYGILMDDLLLAVETYYQKNKKPRKDPTKNDIIDMLPDHVKEMIPPNKRKYKKEEDKKAVSKTKSKNNFEDEAIPPPSETLKTDQNETENYAEDTSALKKSKTKTREVPSDKSPEVIDDSVLPESTSEEDKNQDE